MISARVLLAALAVLAGPWPGCEGVIEPVAPRVDTPEPPPIESCFTERDVQTAVLRPSCGTSSCHDARAPRAGLDLVSFDLQARLEGATSVHEACAETPLLVPGLPEESLLVTKLLGTHGACGEPMPAQRDLEPAAIRCVAEWVASLERRAAP